MNGNSGNPATDQDASETAPEAPGGEPGGPAGEAAQESGKPPPRGVGQSSADGPDAIDLDSVHDRAS